jgi:hypothetical protein
MAKLTLGGEQLRQLGSWPIALAGIAALAMAVVLGGCGSVDPTDPSHFVDVPVHNDLSFPVRLIQCDTSCDTLHDRQTLAASASTTLNISNEGISVGYLVESRTGHRLGCIYLEYEQSEDPAAVPISSMTQCN